MLDDAYERRILCGKVNDMRLGLFIVRSESIVMIGELSDNDVNFGAEGNKSGPLQSISTEEMVQLFQTDEGKAELERQKKVWKFGEW